VVADGVGYEVYSLCAQIGIRPDELLCYLGAQRTVGRQDNAGELCLWPGDMAEADIAKQRGDLDYDRVRILLFPWRRAMPSFSPGQRA